MTNNFILKLEAEVRELREQNEQLKEEIKRLLTPPKATVRGLDPDAWKTWELYRRRLGKRPYKTTTVAERLAGHPPEVQRAMVKQSIDNEWHGLFDLKQRPGAPVQQPTEEKYL